MTSAALPTFDAKLDRPLRTAARINTLQINIGLRCNLACKHCHVESSPKRSGGHENMDSETADRVLRWLDTADDITTVDFTGGSPEMNPNFRRMVSHLRQTGRHVIDRCNPTVLVHETESEEFRWAPKFLADHSVEVYASLPCYLPDNVRAQRGLHAYDASIAGLRLLCDEGYGTHPDRPLNLVFNPVGAKLPPAAEGLEIAYRDYLSEHFGLSFTRLVTITNMPIARWADHLDRVGARDDYQSLLVGAFNPETIDGLMCRHQIHIDSRGRMYDCDFNYAARLPAMTASTYLWDINPASLGDRPVATASHCFGCTAGTGSSCGGSLVNEIHDR